MFIMENDIVRNNVQPSASCHSTDSSGRNGNPGTLRNRITPLNLLQPSSFINLLSNAGRQRVLQSYPTIEDVSNDKSLGLTENTKAETNKKGWKAIVTIVLVEAKGLPDPPSDSSVHNVYCKIRLGSETCKSKSVPSAHNPEWRERLQMHLNKDQILRISLWDKGRQKNFMGGCVVDLSSFEKERAHDIWLQLDDGFGVVHLNITVCTVRNDKTSSVAEPNMECVKEAFALLNLNNWKIVGQLHVKVIAAKGFSGKPNAYCILELDNERVRTSNARASSEPVWNKTYVFNVYDVTSTLIIKVHDSSMVHLLQMEYLGKVSIPLLRISNRATRWYALKDRSNRKNAKGNCPRVLLEMTVIWNPVKAAVRLLRPKEVKYIKKPTKFDVALVHSNMEFVRDTFNFLYEVNESFKNFLEWENTDFSTMILAIWLIFWMNFEVWIVPLLLLLPFLYFWLYQRYEHDTSFARSNVEDKSGQNDSDKNETSISSLTNKIHNLPETTLTITKGVEYSVLLVERLYNLVSFQVPFLSILTMIFLVFASITLYLIPIKYLLMAFGTYKYARKRLNPDRTPNNDILDFISRIPDFETMKDWKELSVPEPVQHINSLGDQVN